MKKYNKISLLLTLFAFFMNACVMEAPSDSTDDKNSGSTQTLPNTVINEEDQTIEVDGEIIKFEPSPDPTNNPNDDDNISEEDKTVMSQIFDAGKSLVSGAKGFISSVTGFISDKLIAPVVKLGVKTLTNIPPDDFRKFTDEISNTIEASAEAVGEEVGPIIAKQVAVFVATLFSSNPWVEAIAGNAGEFAGKPIGKYGGKLAGLLVKGLLNYVANEQENLNYSEQLANQAIKDFNDQIKSAPLADGVKASDIQIK